MESPPPLPEGYEWIATHEGERVLVQRARYWSLYLLIGVLVLGGGYVAFVQHDPFGTLFPIAIALPFAAIRISRSRDEWQIGPDRLTLRRRSLGRVRMLVETRRLVLEQGMDGDYGPVCELYTLTDPRPPVDPADEVAGQFRGNRETVLQTFDVERLRLFAAWLARTTQVEIIDRTTLAPAIILRGD